MGVVPLAIALAVSFMSAITLLGISAENYAHGTQVTLLYLGGFVGTPIALYFYLPVFYKLKATSVYEVIGRRSISNFFHFLLFFCSSVFRKTFRDEGTSGGQRG